MKLSRRALLFLGLLLSVALVACGVKTYEVKFIDHDGTVLHTEKVNEGEAATAPTNPSREGYTFNGWDVEFEVVESDLSVNAVYTIIVYEVVFKDHDGTILKTESVNHGNDATAPANPIRDGYVFKGWNVTFTNITNYLEVLAVYEKEPEPSKEEFLVTFQDLSGRILSLDLVLEGSMVDKPQDPLKTGEIFDSWYVDETFEIEWDFQQPILNDTVIFAHFYLTIPSAIEIGSELSHDQITNESYYVKGRVKSIDNLEYGNMTISDDDNNDFYVYGIFSRDGLVKYGDMIERPVVGDVVYLYGPLKKYNESIELNNSRLIKFELDDREPEIDINDYLSVNIDIAWESDIDTKVLVEGVVASITFANGFKPNGLYLVDDHGAIYIYSDAIASSVSIGDKIQVAGTRANFILGTEIGFAELHGYQGAIQIADAHLISRLGSGFDIAKDWIQPKTMKELMDTDHRIENITGTIFEVTAFVRKSEGSGFTNYYFNDLDNETGSYTYTMNNGNDFSWLDQFDGELRTVYLSIINAKASAAGIVYRLYPVAIGDIVEYDQAYNPTLAVKYYGVGQFKPEYLLGFSPDLEMTTSITAPWLDIETVSLEYTSSNPSVAYFELVDEKLIFKTNELGTAVITIKGIDGENSYLEEVTVLVKEPAPVEFITVAEAIAKVDDTIVTVKGIVAASLVNQTGFYLIDDTGIVAVRMSGVELGKLNLGNEVIIEGKKTHVRGSNDPSVSLGQLVIDESSIVMNYEGSHEYQTNFFVEGKTVADINNLDKLEEHSTTAYVFNATITSVIAPYYQNYYLESNGEQIRIYAGSGSQLSFLSDYIDQEVTVEYISVNWNGNNYVGAVIAIIVDGVKIVNNLHFK